MLDITVRTNYFGAVGISDCLHDNLKSMGVPALGMFLMRECCTMVKKRSSIKFTLHNIPPL